MTDSSAMTKLRHALVVEEFKQLHECIRMHEKEMGTLTVAMITAFAALLSAIWAFYLKALTDNASLLSPRFSYLFLAPAIIYIPLMGSIRGHRESIYKMGLYLKVFVEAEFGGTAWHLRLEDYKRTRPNESQDGLPYLAWAMFLVSYGFFAVSLFQIPKVGVFHFALPLLLAFPLGWQHRLHNRIKDIVAIEGVWKGVKGKESDRREP